jgi:hypothetical protein
MFLGQIELRTEKEYWGALEIEEGRGDNAEGVTMAVAMALAEGVAMAVAMALAEGVAMAVAMALLKSQISHSVLVSHLSFLLTQTLTY